MRKCVINLCAKEPEEHIILQWDFPLVAAPGSKPGARRRGDEARDTPQICQQASLLFRRALTQAGLF
jgi:hypothetical protein